MTNEQKAFAWENAAQCLADSLDWQDNSDEGKHIWNVIIPSLRRKAEIIRRTKRKKRKQR